MDDIKILDQKPELLLEMESIMEKRGGNLTTETIVEVAKVPGTLLHEHFKEKGLFDPDKAMEFAQRTYAGILIRSFKIWVQVEQKDPQQIRAFVSLAEDRGKNGYRNTINVLTDIEKRAALLHVAKSELAAFKRKYSILSELAPLFEIIESL